MVVFWTSPPKNVSLAGYHLNKWMLQETRWREFENCRPALDFPWLCFMESPNEGVLGSVPRKGMLWKGCNIHTENWQVWNDTWIKLKTNLWVVSSRGLFLFYFYFHLFCKKTYSSMGSLLLSVQGATNVNWNPHALLLPTPRRMPSRVGSHSRLQGHLY